MGVDSLAFWRDQGPIEFQSVWLKEVADSVASMTIAGSLQSSRILITGMLHCSAAYGSSNMSAAALDHGLYECAFTRLWQKNSVQL